MKNINKRIIERLTKRLGILAIAVLFFSVGFIVFPNIAGFTAVAEDGQIIENASTGDEVLPPDGDEFESFGLGAKRSENNDAALVSPLKLSAGTEGVSYLAAIDLSQDKYFPTIGNQGSLGSCVSWSTTYYTFTYEVARLNDWTVRNGGVLDTSKVFSPQWTYNYINNGTDGGSYNDDAFTLLKTSGAATLAEVPYALNYREWVTDGNIMRNALKSRVSSYKSDFFASGSTPITSNTDSDLNKIKAQLNQNHPVVFQTDVGSGGSDWIVRYGTSEWGNIVMRQESYLDIHGNPTWDGHSLTIVGYNDDVTCDLNNNGIIEDFERGAFKIANSWGTSWGNAGFIWVMYDALNKQSNTPEQNASTGKIRSEIFDLYEIFYIEVANYSLDVTCEVTLNSNQRSDINVQISGKDGANPTVYADTLFSVSLYMGVGRGGAYSFKGTTIADDATFVFDYGSAVANFDTSQLTVIVSDRGTLSGSTLIKSIKFYHGDTLLKSETPNLNLNSGSKSFYYPDSNVSELKLNPNGGTISPLLPIVGDNVTIPTLAPKRSGHNFDGWAANSLATTPDYLPGEIVHLDADLTLYAVWTDAPLLAINTPTASVVCWAEQEIWYKYVASGTSIYSFTSIGSLDVIGYIYDSIAASELAKDDDSGEGMNFLITYGMTAGRTYYLKARSYNVSSTGSFTVLLKDTVTYTVSYNANGGNGAPATQTKPFGETLVLRADILTRTGYTFLGWSPDSGAVTPVYQPGGDYTDEASVVLYAVWHANTYSVIYNANGGSGDMSDSAHTYNTTSSLTLNAFTRPGYTFAGWAVSAGGNVIYGDGYSGNLNLTTTDDGTVNLYAVWTANAYSVKYNANGGSGDMSDSAYAYDTASELTANAFTRTGYIYVGWATEEDGTVEYTDGQNVINLTTTAGGTVNIYAVWQAITYGVRYNANGGSGDMSDSTHIYDTASALTVNAFTRIGYNFARWATDDDIIAYTNGQSVLNLTATDGDIINLYAIWHTGVIYTVRYNANGGNGTMSDSAHVYDSEKTLTANTFIRAGYTYAGWATAADGSVVYADGQKVVNLTTTNGDRIELYAVWTANTYAVQYNANNGTGDMSDSAHIYNTASELTVNAFTRTGYAFAGWATTEDGSVKYTDGQSVINLTTANGATVNVYAVWGANIYGVNYNANGGTGEMSDSEHVYDTASELTANAFVNTGYTFIGWATDAEGSIEYVDGQSVLNLTSTAGATVSLYAVWTVNNYVVAYNANGGSGEMSDSEHVYDTAKELTVNVFTRTGYAFAGWAADAYGIVEYTDGQSVINLTASDKETFDLYAVWSANVYSVKYSANGGSGDMSDSEHAYNTAKKLTANAFTRTGYTFIGWATSAIGSLAYTDGQSIINLTSTAGDTINLYAVWTVNTYSVAYDSNGGSGFTSDSSHIYNLESKLSANAFTRTGYIFGGWATEADGSLIYVDRQIVKNLTSTAGEIVTLYAFWIAHTYSIKYNANGGNGVMSDSLHLYGTASELTANAFTRTGYSFVGWAATSAGQIIYADGQSVVSLTSINGEFINLYAVWTINNYVITYDANGGTGKMSDSSHTYGIAKALTANAFVRANYSFIGWATSADGQIAYGDRETVINVTLVADEIITLYAVWHIDIVYGIRYNANGGSGEMSDSSHAYNTASVLTANTFERIGYSYAGWATSASGPIVYGDREAIMNLTAIDDEIVNLYAVWKANTYVVKYNANGGIGSMLNSSHTYNTVRTLTVNAYVRTGYTFAGWATSVGTLSYADGQSVANLTATNGATVNLYAVWTANTYVVKYNPNGGKGATPDSVHTYGITSELTANAFERIGYTFAGWAESTGTLAYVDAQSVLNLTATDGVTISLYAVWTANTYGVRYNANGGSGEMSDSAHAYDAAKALSANTFTMAMYVFTGWATEADGKVVYTNLQSVINLTSTDGETIDLYALWQSNVFYKVGYNANGGSGKMSDSSHVYDTAKELTINAFTRSGYAFAGWSTEADGEIVYGDRESVLNLTTTSGDRLDIYAVWIANTYGVNYNPNGGNGEMSDSVHVYDTESQLTSNVFARPDYTFAGWAYSSGSLAYADGETVINLTTTNDATIKLYAVWVINTYSVIYNPKGGVGEPSNQIKTHNKVLTLSSVEPTRVGYVFLGWSSVSTAFAVEYLPDSQYVENENLTLYAVWQGTGNSLASPPAFTQSAYTMEYKGRLQLHIKNGSGPYKFSSDNDKVTVDPNTGIVNSTTSFTKTMTATITITDSNNNTDTCTVKVSPSPLQWFYLIVLFGWIWM
ncbi:MAG: InlB B-repeat-containing protein [Clostridiaceae bacterium]|nr:InlB B-repeat-containing protein [Clostridiaceae bacterium]